MVEICDIIFIWWLPLLEHFETTLRRDIAGDYADQSVEGTRNIIATTNIYNGWMNK